MQIGLYGNKMSDDTTYIQLMQYTAGTSFMFLLWLCAYFFRNGSGNRLRQITGWVLLVWVIQSVKDMALIWYPTVRFEFLHHVFVLIDMTAVPTCAFLLFELTRPGSMALLRAALHEIPFILFILIYAFHPKDILYESAIACAVAYGTAVMLYVLFEIPAYHKRLKQSYSYHERIDLRWLYIILLSFVVFLAVWSLTSTYYSEFNDTLYYLLTCIIWSLISYFINRQEQVLGSLTTRSHQDVEMPQENGEEPHQFTIHLHRIFEEEHLYLNPKLTIMDLAQAIGTNRTYISNYLNNVLGTTFFDYVNQYRLSHAERLLRQTKMPIEEIADRSGFNSRSTFRRAFLKRFGCAPSQYRLHHLPKEIEKEISLTR